MRWLIGLATSCACHLFAWVFDRLAGGTRREAMQSKSAYENSRWNTYKRSIMKISNGDGARQSMDAAGIGERRKKWAFFLVGLVGGVQLEEEPRRPREAEISAATYVRTYESFPGRRRRRLGGWATREIGQDRSSSTKKKRRRWTYRPGVLGPIHAPIPRFILPKKKRHDDMIHMSEAGQKQPKRVYPT